MDSMDSMEEEPTREYASVDQILDTDLPEEDVEVRPGVWMRVRALTRAEMIRSGRLEENRARQEQFLVSIASIKPKLTEEDVARWQRASRFMELEKIGRKINELGGIGKDAAKSDVSDDGDES